MSTTVTIGEFARLTLLSVKALRHYHDVGLLEPAEIDAGSGYRRYDLDQVTDAQLIRRLRELDMPVPDVRAVVGAPDAEARDALLRDHLDRMQATLARTADVVASLRAALDPLPDLSVEHRHLPAQPAVVVRADVGEADFDAFFDRAFATLYAAVEAAGRLPTGPGGAVYDHGWFADEVGEIVAYVPVLDPEGIDAEAELLPAVDVAVGTHAGPYADFDRTYGALGRHVNEHCGSSGAAIREVYVIGPDRTDDPDHYRTDVCWPTGPAV